MQKNSSRPYVSHLTHHSPSSTASLKSHQLKQELLQKEQQVTSLEHRLKTAEDESERHETALKDLKTRAEESDGHKTTGENLSRKVQMLEEELERNEKELKEVNEK